MSGPCPWHRELDAYEALEPEARPASLRAHLTTCEDCRTELDWRDRERSLIMQRAARASGLPSLEWGTLEARLEQVRATSWQPVPPSRASMRLHWRAAALPSLAASLIAMLPLLFDAGEAVESEERVRGSMVQACFLPDEDVLRRQELALKACLVEPISVTWDG